ncbi:hypothetical protein ACFU96_47505 [Streptomyces sp. NPDC057620]|uniref:hypothetical protein n=1 Tax=Streptomyces sp. NPDC057620 TaxID=3346185 RepID=UPI0036A428C2
MSDEQMQDRDDAPPPKKRGRPRREIAGHDGVQEGSQQDPAYAPEKKKRGWPPKAADAAR